MLPLPLLQQVSLAKETRAPDQAARGLVKVAPAAEQLLLPWPEMAMKQPVALGRFPVMAC